LGARATCRRAVISAAALLATICLAAPAVAQTGTFTDAKKDVEFASGKTQKVTYGRDGLDIYWTRIRYADGKLIIRTKFENLTRCNTQALARCRPWNPTQYVYLDTTPDPADATYQDEYHAFYLDHHVGLSDANASRNCPGLRWSSNLQRDTSTFVIPRFCLRRVDRHRVRVRVTASKNGRVNPKTGYGDLVTDTVGWTPWIQYG
jgi:hypothetical protein